MQIYLKGFEVRYKHTVYCISKNDQIHLVQLFMVGTSLFSFPLKFRCLSFRTKKFNKSGITLHVQTAFITSVKCYFQSLPGSSVQLCPLSFPRHPFLQLDICPRPPQPLSCSAVLLTEEGKDIFQLA